MSRRRECRSAGEAAMVSKCANPACTTPFRYLHEGRIFTVGADAQHRSADGAGSNIERYWLCSSCCASMTLVLDRGHVALRTLASIPEAGWKPRSPTDRVPRHRFVA